MLILGKASHFQMTNAYWKQCMDPNEERIFCNFQLQTLFQTMSSVGDDRRLNMKWTSLFFFFHSIVPIDSIWL